MVEFDSLSPVSLTSAHLFADLCEDLLRRGTSVRFHAPGRSMYPTIKENEVITVEPVETCTIKGGDILLFRRGKSVVAHRLVRIVEGAEGSRLCVFQGDGLRTGGEAVVARRVLGKVVSVERNGRAIDPYGRKARFRLLIHSLGSRIKWWILQF